MAHAKAAGWRFAKGVPHVTARVMATRDGLADQMTGDNGVADNWK
jgi:hypothetical protein